MHLPGTAGISTLTSGGECSWHDMPLLALMSGERVAMASFSSGTAQHRLTCHSLVSRHCSHAS